MKRIVGLLAIVFLTTGLWSGAWGSTFDTNSVASPSPGGNSSPFNWGSYDEFNRYQLWFSNDVLETHSGTVFSLIHYATTSTGSSSMNVGLEVYCSTTDKEGAVLSTTDFDGNHGANKVKVFDGNAFVPSYDNILTIDVDDVFVYDGTGNW